LTILTELFAKNDYGLMTSSDLDLGEGHWRSCFHVQSLRKVS